MNCCYGTGHPPDQHPDGARHHIFQIGYGAKLTGENLELLEQIVSNPDNIDYGEMVLVVDSTDSATTAFTARGIKNLQELLANIRASQGGVQQFLIDEDCSSEMIERIMKVELR
ncbi:MAG: hypothetical protein ACI9IV_000245 [Paracoccaceae bacterium]|jgi:hypothetical protein